MSTSMFPDLTSKSGLWKMPAWTPSDEYRNRSAFVTLVPILVGAFPRSASPKSSVQLRIHTERPWFLPRKAASLQTSQECNRAAPLASMGDSNRAGLPVVLLVDHGSRRAVANHMLSDVGSMLQEKTDLSVYTAHMELASPTIAEGVDKCVKEGATHIIVVPFFLSPGRHSTTDIPQMTAEALASHPGVTFEVRPPIGTHPGIIDIILDRAGLLGSVQN